MIIQGMTRVDAGKGWDLLSSGTRTAGGTKVTEKQIQALAARISELRDRIARVRKKNEPIGEEDTKRVFVNPLLQTLGWDIQDLDEVRNQYRHRSQDNPVDYALFTLRTPCLFVEAKPLSASLDDRKWTSQTIGYAATAGVEWCVLTNGDEYRLYNAHAPVDADEKLFRKVRLSDEAPDAVTTETLDLLSKSKMEEKELNVLWKAHFVDRQVKAVLEMIIHTPDPSLVRLLNKKTSGLTRGDIQHSLKRAEFQVGFPISPSSALQTEAQDRARRKPQPSKSRDGKKGDGQKKGHNTFDCTLKDLIDAGLISPPFELEAKWRKQRFAATVEKDGTVTFQGKQYSSLSVSGGMARNIASGPPKDGRPYYQTNGWTFWKCHDKNTGKPEIIDLLRQRYLKIGN